MVKDYNANTSSNGRGGTGGSSSTVTTNGATPAVAVVRHANPANARMNAPHVVETSEDEMSNPRTPTSVSSQGSQGYDSAGSDFVDIEGFTAIPDTSLPELNLQVQGLPVRVTPLMHDNRKVGGCHGFWLCTTGAGCVLNASTRNYDKDRQGSPLYTEQYLRRATEVLLRKGNHSGCNTLQESFSSWQQQQLFQL